MATLLGIAVKPQRRKPLRAMEAITISRERGLEGDCRGAPGKRQVTLMTLSGWQAACRELGVEYDWKERRANLLVDALPLAQSTGSRIRLGEVVLEITGETDPCERMEALHPGLFEALAREWRGGVTCRVLQGGSVAVGSAVTLQSE